MKTTDLLAVALRVIALVLLCMALQAAAQQYLLINQSSNLDMGVSLRVLQIAALVQVLLLVLPGLALLKFPQTLASMLLPTRLDTQISSDLTAEELQTAAFCVLGVFFLATSLSDLFSNTAWIIYALQAGPDEAYDLPDSIISALVSLVELTIGLLLCLKAHGLTQLIRRLRSVAVQ